MRLPNNMLFKHRKIKFQSQMNTSECAAACIKMLCDYHKISITYSTITELLSPTREGVSILALENTLKNIGLQCETYKIPISQINTISLPAILLWEKHHFVILSEICNRNKSFIIFNPSNGKSKISLAELENKWGFNKSKDEGIATIIKHISAPKLSIQPTKQESLHIGFFIKFLLRFKKYFFHIFLGLLLGLILQGTLPFLTKSVVDLGILNKNLNIIWLILLGELMIVFGQFSSELIRRRLTLHLSVRLNFHLISIFILKLFKLPMSFFDKKFIGDILQRINDHHRIQDFITSKLIGSLFSILSLIILGILLLFYDKYIFLIFVLCNCLYSLWIRSFLKKRKLIDYQIFENTAQNQSNVYQLINTIQEIKLQNCEHKRTAEWENIQLNLFNTKLNALKLDQTMNAGTMFITELKNVLITAFCAMRVIDGNLSFGAMIAIQYIIGQLNSPIDLLIQFIYSLQDVKISFDRILEIFDKQDEDSLAYKPNYIFDRHSDSSIIINNLHYRYDTNQPLFILNNISCCIPHGKVTAIVGNSGSGKTTFLKMLLGFYPPEIGDIFICGKSLNHYNLKNWRNNCGIVMQDSHIFSDTIASNIAIGDTNVNQCRLIQAAKIANIYSFINSLPLKFDTLIGENGIGISQGQKQRILIARAIYKNPIYIFFDEATNSLDAYNESIITKRLEKIFKNKTVIIAAHRLSTIKNADQIIVLDNGRIVETGTHLELLRNRKHYYNLVKTQLGFDS